MFFARYYMNVTNEKAARGSVLRPLLIITIVATFIGAALRCVNLFLFFEEEIGYFAPNAVLPTVMHIFFALCVAFFLICSVMLRKKKLVGCDDKNLFVTFSSAFAAITLLLIAFYTVYSFVALNSTAGESNIKTLFFGAALALSSVYFFMNTAKRSSDAQGLLVIVLIAVIVFIVATLYFDVTIPMNSPNQILFNMAAISALLFFISESKARISTEKTWLYVFSLCSAAFLCGVYAIPSIIRFGTLSTQFHIFALFLSFFIYFLSRLVTLLTHAEEIYDRVEAAEEQYEETETDSPEDAEKSDESSDEETE